MKLIVGLGNPGEEHKNNRHNVGFMVVDGLSNEKWSSVRKFQSLIIKKGQKFILAKPQTYMNSSGKAVKKIVDHFKIKTSDLWVIHDDLDISLGDFKIQKGKGPRLHKGVISIEKELGKSDFWRVRVGVENRDPENRIPGEAYVLQDFKEEEMEIIKSVVNEISKELLINE
ncbi:MAG: aminoacyl-tRNA hydrolase [Patescibacteria group bacterium]